MMELAAIYKQRSVECERRGAEAKEEPDKEAWRSRAADFRTLAVKFLRTPLDRACTSLEILRRIGGHPRQCLTDQPPVARSVPRAGPASAHWL